MSRKPPKYVKTDAQLAKFIPNISDDSVGVSTRSIATWKKRTGWPNKTKRGWNLEKCVRFVIRHKKELAKRGQGKPSPNMSAARESKTRLQSALLQEELDEIRGKKIDKADAKHAMRDVSDIFLSLIRDLRAIAAGTRNKKLLERFDQRIRDGKERVLERIDEL